MFWSRTSSCDDDPPESSPQSDCIISGYPLPGKTFLLKRKLNHRLNLCMPQTLSSASHPFLKLFQPCCGKFGAMSMHLVHCPHWHRAKEVEWGFVAGSWRALGSGAIGFLFLWGLGAHQCSLPCGCWPSLPVGHCRCSVEAMGQWHPCKAGQTYFQGGVAYSRRETVLKGHSFHHSKVGGKWKVSQDKPCFSLLWFLGHWGLVPLPSEAIWEPLAF